MTDPKKTMTLVQLYTALTQIMSAKVNAGDNSEVKVYVDLDDVLACNITGLHLVHTDDGKLKEIFIETGDYL